MFTYLAGFPLTLPLVELTATEWVQANETPVEKNSYRVRGLPVGEKMLFRVTAVNIAGRSPPAVLAQAVTIREIVGETLTYIHTYTNNIQHTLRRISRLLNEITMGVCSF